MSSASYSPSCVTIAGRSLKNTFKNALNQYSDQLEELEAKRSKQEAIGNLFLIFKPEDLSDFSSQPPSVIESFVVTLMMLKYKVYFVQQAGSNATLTYNPSCILRMEWAAKPDEVEEIPTDDYPIKHAYQARNDTLLRATNDSAYGKELEDFENKRKEAERSSKFVFTITLGRIGDLGNSDDPKRLQGFILLLKAHGYSVRHVTSRKKDIDSADSFDSASQFVVDMLGR